MSSWFMRGSSLVFSDFLSQSKSFRIAFLDCPLSASVCLSVWLCSSVDWCAVPGVPCLCPLLMLQSHAPVRGLTRWGAASVRVVGAHGGAERGAATSYKELRFVLQFT